jgi:hypothetical protein
VALFKQRNSQKLGILSRCVSSFSERTDHLFCRTPLAKSLRFEPLEDRRMLAVLTVDTDQDVVDFNDGVTSLREAIFAANIVPGADEIVFDLGDESKTMLLTNGELKITDSLTITGPGAELLIIQAFGGSIFVIDDSLGYLIDATISGLTLTGATNSAIRSTEKLVVSEMVFRNNLGVRGGAIRADSSFSQSTGMKLSVHNSRLVDNHATGDGGAIYFSSRTGELNIVDSFIEANTAVGRGGGVNSGHDSTVTILDSIFSENEARDGGGVYFVGDDSRLATVERSTFRENVASKSGGGLYFGYKNASIRNSTITGNRALGGFPHYGGGGIVHTGTLLTIADSTISHNSTNGNGGGLWSRGSFGQTILTNTTITNNSAEGTGGGISFNDRQFKLLEVTVSGNTSGVDGGGIHAWGDYRSTSTIENSTIDNNWTAGDGGGVSLKYTSILNSTISGNSADGSGGGVFIYFGYQQELAHSTITDNRADANSDGVGRGGGVFSTGYQEIDHAIVAGNHDNSGRARDLAGWIDSKHSLIGFGEEFLEPLADNGGSTKTHALLPGSPAIEGGRIEIFSGVDGIPEFDQRGVSFARIYGYYIDIGAYEYQPTDGGLDGDFDLDGDIDGRDLLTWQRNMGSSGPQISKSHGDATGDGDVDANDLAVWQATYGKYPAPGIVAALNVESEDSFGWLADSGITSLAAMVPDNDSDDKPSVELLDQVFAGAEQDSAEATPTSFGKVGTDGLPSQITKRSTVDREAWFTELGDWRSVGSKSLDFRWRMSR